MRSDLKIGIIVGVLLVVGLIVFFISRGGERAEPSATPAVDEAVAGRSEQEAITPPARQETAPPAEQQTTLPTRQAIEPPATQEVAPPVEQAAAPPVEQKVAPPVDEEERKPRYYTVKEGDTLSAISLSYYAEEKFVAVIQAANKELIKDVNKLQPGWRLRIPYPDEADEIWKTIK